MKSILVNGVAHEVADRFDELKPHQITRYIADVLLPLPDAIGRNDEGETIIKNYSLLDEINLNAIELLIDNDELTYLLSIPQVLQENDTVVVVDDQPVIYSNILFLIQEKVALFLFKDPDLFKPLEEGFNSWAAPAEKFNNLRLEEYFYCEELYKAFLEHQDWSLLKDLAAILYRPLKKNLDTSAADYDGDRREPFNRYTFKARAELIDQEADQGFLSGVFLWYMSCRTDLVKRFPLLYERKKSALIQLKPTEELVEMCGGAFSFDTNKHQRVVIVWADLHAKLIRAKTKQ